MPYSITIPFHAVKLRFLTEGELWFPLLDRETLRMNADLHDLAEKYASSFQQNMLNAGQFLPVLHELKSGDYLQKRFSVKFGASIDKISHPAFELDFEYFCQVLRTGSFWGMVPVLGCEAVAATEDALEKSLEEMIRLDFSSNNRLAALQQVASLLWYDSIELLSHPIKAVFPGPSEVRQNHTHKQEGWLQKAAYLVSPNKAVAYGREAELHKMIRALKSPYMKNVLLLGAGGVGKTALAHELIRQKNKAGIAQEIWETTASLMIKELSGEMGWQENLSQFCKELKVRNAFLFVRNLYDLFEVGKYEGNTVSMAEYLLPYLSRGEITLISECTVEEKAVIELRSPSFLTHFQLLPLEEPTVQLEEIILKKVGDIAKDQKVVLSEEAIQELIRLNKRYTPYAGFPGKPIRFLESLLLQKRSVFKEGEKRTKLVLDKSEIIGYFCRETGMPPFMADPFIPVDFEEVRARFASNVFGQENAVDSLVNVLTAVKTGMNRTGKPIASFLFVGPTGVGKTELVKVLAEFMFGSRDRLTRFDMSEFSTAYSVRSMIGMGEGSGGLLTNAVRREPFSVILFDEVEKAHHSFFDFLLQVLSEGRLTDSSGKIANFCSAIIILTSNIGAANLQSNRIGWKKEAENSVIRQHFLSAVQQFFRPELFNRIDQVISFAPLSAETMHQVIGRELRLLKEREGIAGRKMSLEISESAMSLLAENGFNPLYGARYLQRTLQTQLAIPLAKLLNQWDPLDHALVKVERDGARLSIQTTSDPLSMDLLMEELEKFNLANLCTDKRNDVRHFGESASYLELINNLAILEREKERQPDRFWADESKSKQYDMYGKAIAAFSKIKEEIEALESEISLSCMGYAPYTPAFSQQLDDWKDEWKQFRAQLFRQLFPGDKCWLCIYGKDPTPILELYHQIAVQKKYQVQGYYVWFHPSPPPKGVKMPNGMIPTPSGKETFFIRPWKPAESFEERNHAIPMPDSILYGFHFYITGPGAMWFFQGEEGVQKWVKPNESPDIYSVNLNKEGMPKIPPTVHRRDFYGPPRRVVTKQTFSDTAYKIKDAPYTLPLHTYLSNLLEKKFQEMVDEAFD